MRGTINNPKRSEIEEKKIKRCSKCKENHPIEWFNTDLERPDGYDNKCSLRKIREAKDG